MSSKKEEVDDSGDEGMDDLSDPDIVTKYRMAGTITAEVLKAVIAKCVPGAKVLDLCVLGDNMLLEKVGSCFKSKHVEKGIAFPTCVSVNNCVGHNSPLPQDEEQAIREGDMVKIDLGCHLGGYIAAAAQTVVVTNPPTSSDEKVEPLTGRPADVIVCAQTAADYVLKSLKPGIKNTTVTAGIKKIAEAFECNPVEQVVSHQIKCFVPEANKYILNRVSPDEKYEEDTFEEGEAYTIDIIMSTGEGKVSQQESRTTVYRRKVDVSYNLKLKAARQVFNDINQKFPTMPFTVRMLDEKRGRLGVREMVMHNLVVPYPVVFEKSDELVAQVKFTVLLLPTGALRVACLPEFLCKSAHQVADPEVKAVLSTSAKNKKKKPKSKKKVETEKVEKTDE